MNSVLLSSRPYLDSYNQCYSNIVIVNRMPSGPLSKLVMRVQFLPLSEFKAPGPWGYRNDKFCGLALRSLHRGCNNLMIVDEVPDLFSFLLSHGYKIDTSLTKMMNTGPIQFHTDNANKIICFVTYEKP